MNTQPLPALAAPKTVINANQIAAGRPISALDRLRIMSANEWEDFTLEYAHSLAGKYHAVERHAGAGDMGCDVVARVNGTTDGAWDNYQCKHYDHSLTPVEAVKEIGKCCYYAWRGEYTLPRAYYFVAPRGAGPKLSKLLKKPAKLKAELFAAWDDHCRRTITTAAEVPMVSDLRIFIETADFSMFAALSPILVVEQHAKTPWHAARFGGGLKPRPVPPQPPTELAANESSYVRCLLEAYEEQLGRALAGISDLSDVNLAGHLQRARHEFYSAESLREFSRDNVPDGTFEQLLDEVYSGVIDIVEATHPNAMARVRASVAQAKSLALTSHPLVTSVTTTDKGGMCHQLANNGRVHWRK